MKNSVLKREQEYNSKNIYVDKTLIVKPRLFYGEIQGF